MIDEMDADDEAEKNSSRGKDSHDKDEEKDKVVDLKDDGKNPNGNNVHKKRRRKNVESRDVST